MRQTTVKVQVIDIETWKIRSSKQIDDICLLYRESLRETQFVPANVHVVHHCLLPLYCVNTSNHRRPNLNIAKLCARESAVTETTINAIASCKLLQSPEITPAQRFFFESVPKWVFG